MRKLRILFVADIHGSSLLFRKALTSSISHAADLLILAGDLSGKELHPIVFDGHSFSVTIHGETRHYADAGRLSQVRSTLADVGEYFIDCELPYLDQLRSDPALVRNHIRQESVKRLTSWIQMARERINSHRMTILITPGNDDDDSFDGLAEAIQAPGFLWSYNGIVRFQEYEILNYGDSNLTPWHTPREKPESEIEGDLTHLFERARRLESVVCNIHCPPYGTLLDLAVSSEGRNQPRVLIPSAVESHVGSIAVRKSIEAWQPLVSLHGHVHESPGVQMIGRTLCLNPGSEYRHGVLNAFVIELKDDSVTSYFRISG